MQKMKANFRVLAETLLQAKWQMDKKETHIDMERERYKKKMDTVTIWKVQWKEKTQKREADRGLTQSGDPPISSGRH